MSHLHIQRADLRDFAGKMLGQLNLNHHKELDTATQQMDPYLYVRKDPLDLLAEARKHLDRLEATIKEGGEPDKAFRNAADSANFLMMTANGHYMRLVDPEFTGRGVDAQADTSLVLRDGSKLLKN